MRHEEDSVFTDFLGIFFNLLFQFVRSFVFHLFYKFLERYNIQILTNQYFCIVLNLLRYSGASKKFEGCVISNFTEGLLDFDVQPVEI